MIPARGSGLALDGGLQPFANRLEDFYPTIVFVVGLHQGPRRDLGRRAIDHVADCLFIERPLLAVAPVLGGDLEALEAGFLAFLETAQLFVLADAEPELD